MEVIELYQKLNEARAHKGLPPVDEEKYLSLIAKMTVEGSIILAEDEGKATVSNPGR